MSRAINPWLASLLGAALLILSWPPSPLPYLAFVAWIPFLWIEERHYRHADKPLAYYLQIATGLTLWNIGTTWWIWYASPGGAIAAIFLNAQIQTLPWLFFHRIRKVFGNKLAYPALAGMLISVEYLHFNWDIAWPWLVQGNVFASVPWLVQWYEYTGALGGSLWVYALNSLLFLLWMDSRGWRVRINYLLLLLVPAGISALFFRLPTKGGVEVAVIQPNIDPYTDKFSGMSPEDQLKRLFRLSDSVVTPETRLLLWPETALTEQIVEEQMAQQTPIPEIRVWVERHPNLMLITGASTYHFYGKEEALSRTARPLPYNPEQYYDAYNTALAFRAGQPIGVYHKTKLVPGVEKMPYPALFGFLENLAIDLGGTSGSLGRSDSAVVFGDSSLRVAPIICYESVFGEYVTEYIGKGANLLAIITNDGWWKNTPGYRQHFEYARLRAIENRVFVARSANTGVSGFIDDYGKVLQRSEWWTQDALRMRIPVGSTSTFYARSGDYIGRISAFLSILIVVASYVRRITRRGY